MQSSADRCGEQRAHAIDHVLERLAAHELHDHQPLAFVLEQLVDGRDARMAEPGDGDRFGPEPLGDFWIVQFGIQNFDRHLAMERFVQRPIDRAHAAAANPVQDPVLADILPDHSGYIVAETMRNWYARCRCRSLSTIARSWTFCVVLRKCKATPEVVSALDRVDLEGVVRPRRVREPSGRILMWLRWFLMRS